VSTEEGPRGVTEITHIENYTDMRILAWNRENDREYYIPVATAPGRPGRVNVNWWVPWCTSEEDYAFGHSIVIFRAAIGLEQTPKFQIWQRDVDWIDRVRWTNLYKWDPRALPMPGDSHVNGRRILKIYKLDGPATEDNLDRAELVE
jgi:hypothetical protein